MKVFFLFAFGAIFFGCSDTTTTYTKHELVVTPKILTFAHGDTIRTLSITHTCTCPFSWNVNVLDSTRVLQNLSGIGDNAQLQIHIDRSKLSGDTLKSSLQITSNGYGTDTVQVTVLK